MVLVVLVNGLPGSGKTTLAGSLADALELPMVSKDVIKETLADVLGEPPPGCTPLQWSRMLGAAAGETMWTLLTGVRRGAVLESPWLTPLRPVVAAGLDRAGVDVVHEVWCQVPVVVARRRYEARADGRHAIHDDGRVDDAQWQEWAAHAEPLGLGAVHRVDTSKPVDIGWLVEQFSVPGSQESCA